MRVRRRHAPMATTPIIHMRAHHTDTMGRNGLLEVSSSALAPGITAITGTATTDADTDTMDAEAMATTDAEAMATTDAVATDRALTDTGAAELVTEAMPTVATPEPQ
jgi:hypothetical protein